MTVVDAPSLFDQLPNDVASRASDPATSKVAAKQKDPRPDQADILRVLRLATVALTCEQVRDELVRHLGKRRERNEVASRLAELGDDKHNRWPDNVPLARKVGVRANHRGRPVATWSLTAAGLAAAKALDS